MSTPRNIDPQRLGEALLELRKRAPKAPLSKLYDKHATKLLAAARGERT